MADAAEILKTASVTLGDRVRQLPRPNFGVEAAFVKYCKQRAILDINAFRRELGEDGYRIMLRELAATFACGELSWMSQRVQGSIQNEEWFKELLFLMVHSVPDQRDVTREMIDDAWRADDGAALAAAWNEVTAPNSRKPAQPQEPAPA